MQVYDRRHRLSIGAAVAAATLFLGWGTAALPAQTPGSADAYWPQWRGPQGDGSAAHADPPWLWEPECLLWSVPLEGEGSGSPVVWGNRVFLLSARDTGREPEAVVEPHPDARTIPPPRVFEYRVDCFDRLTGARLWTQVACESAPHEGRHRTNTYASSSAVTDGQRVYASFGSRGIYCYDFDGGLVWHRDLGDMNTRYGWGEATSPAVDADRLVVNWDHEGPSFIVALRASTGEIVWRQERDEPTSWATPLITEWEGRRQVVVNGTNRATGYDLITGEVIWQCGGQTVNAIPTPVRWEDQVICMSGYQDSAVYAIPLDSSGDITDSETVRWSFHQGTPYVPSPVLWDGRLYFTQGNGGALRCLDATTGALVFGPVRLPGVQNVYASPVAAAGRIYFVGRDGHAVVLRGSDSFEVLGEFDLGEPVDASPALVGEQVLVRTSSRLLCFGRSSQ